MEPDFENTLAGIVDKLVLLFKPYKIILFGSHVWGRPEPSSDIDLLVVVDRSELSPVRRAARAYLSLRGVKVPVEVIVSTQKELERYRQVRGSLTRNILEKGRILYG